MRSVFLASIFVALLTACTTTAQSPGQPLTADIVQAAADLYAAGANRTSGSQVKIIENVQINTYLVSGQSASEVRTSLDRNRPQAPNDGGNFDALTRWGLKWALRYDDNGSSCSLASASVLVEIVVELPALSPSSLLPPEQAEKWQAYLIALAAHESGHVQSVLGGANALRVVMLEAPSMPTCTELGAYLNEFGESQLRALHSRDLAYDQETLHGRSQGAIFP